jgi:RimJ/RimL family protein N-acetyltransferase
MASLHPAVAAPLADVETRRLAVRRLDRDDLDGLTEILADKQVWRFEYGRGLTRAETEAFLDRQLRLWAEHGFGGCGVREAGCPDLIGVVGLGVPEVPLQHLVPPVTVGWRLSPRAWGKGYATEAATALLHQAFTTMGLDRVGCVTHRENRRSAAVAERLGMSFVTQADVPAADGNGLVSVALFQIRAPEFRL